MPVRFNESLAAKPNDVGRQLDVVASQQLYQSIHSLPGRQGQYLWAASSACGTKYPSKSISWSIKEYTQIKTWLCHKETERITCSYYVGLLQAYNEITRR